MADAAATRQPLETPAAGADRLADPAQRGSLHVADRVLQRIAVAAARDVDGVAPSGGGSGPFAGMLGSGYPGVEVDSAGSRVRAQVDVAVLWPRPAAAVAAAVRDAVTQRLQELAAVRVDAVSVTVQDVVRPPRRPEGARVR